MAATTSTAKRSKAVDRVLASGKTSAINPATGRLQELHAPCPTDGRAANVRRVTRENGGGILEVTLRCPRCAGDFVAANGALYLS